MMAVAAGALAGSLALDLGTKAWAWERLQGDPGIVVVDRFFLFDFAFNTGAAFGMLADESNARTFFIVVTLAAFAYLVRLAMTLPTNARSSFVALGLIAGGALGNLHDRIVRVKTAKVYFAKIDFSDLLAHASQVADSLAQTRHYVEIERYGVVDFIVVYYWPGRRWPAFNIADVSLVVGVALFMLYLQRQGKQTAKAGESES